MACLLPSPPLSPPSDHVRPKLPSIAATRGSNIVRHPPKASLYPKADCGKLTVLLAESTNVADRYSPHLGMSLPVPEDGEEAHPIVSQVVRAEVDLSHVISATGRCDGGCGGGVVAVPSA